MIQSILIKHCQETLLMSKLTFNKNFLTGSAMLLFTCALMLSGCNTVEGIGEDIEETGEKIEDSASQ